MTSPGKSPLLGGDHALRWQSGCKEPLEPSFRGARHLFRVTTIKWTAGRPQSCWEAEAAAGPWSPWPCAFPPASVPCSSPSFSCPPRPSVLSAATWPWLLQTIFVLSFHQLLTSGLAGASGPTGAHQSHHSHPKPVPLSLSLAPPVGFL